MRSIGIPRWWLGLFLGVIPLMFFLLDVKEVGYSMAIQNSEVSVSAGSHPAYLAFAFLGILIFWAFLRADLNPVFFRAPSLKRRLAAFALDFVFSMMCMAPIGGLIMLAVEYERTGKFQWQFYREVVSGPTAPSEFHWSLSTCSSWFFILSIR